MASGILLLFPQTTLLGALIGMADMLQVFVLNMTYDFGLKQISLHYLLMFAFLLAPDARRLANVLVLNRAAEPSSQLGSVCDAARESHGARRAGRLRDLPDRHVHVGRHPLVLRARRTGRAAVAAVWHLEHRGDERGRREPARRPERLRSPLAPHHLRHAVRRRLPAHGRFVRALRGERSTRAAAPSR